MTDTTAFRRAAAALTIASFSLAALMGIAALLGAGHGDDEGKVLLTTLIVGCASVCVLCYLTTAGTRWQPVGAGGGAVVLVPTLTALQLVWGDWEGRLTGLLQTFGVGVVGAVTLAQVCLLLALAGARPALRPVLAATVGLAAVVALMVSGTILGKVDGGGIWRVLGVAAILDVLGTLVTIALAKFTAAGTAVPEDLRVAAPRGSLSVRLDGELADEVVKRALSAGTTPSQLVAEALDRYLRPVEGRL